MKKNIFVASVLCLLLFTSVSSFAGNLKRCEYSDKKIYAIMQNGEQVGYAGLGFKSGHVIVSVINTTGQRHHVKVTCELNNHSSAQAVNPGSLKEVSGVGLVADGAKAFRVTRDFCGWGAIQVTFK